MKNLIKRTHFALYILLTCVFISCTHVRIEEYTDVESYCTDTWYVGTRVWVTNWIGMPKSLEMWKQKVVPYHQIDSVRAIQRQMADSCKVKVEMCLKHAR